MIQALYRSPQGEYRTELEPPEIARLLAAGEGLLWVSLDDPHDTEAVGMLQTTFRFHPLTITDCLNSHYQAPKVDVYPDYLFILTHATDVPGENAVSSLETNEFDLYLGGNYVVTFARGAAARQLAELRQRLQIDDRPMESGADYLAYVILDDLLEAYLPLLVFLDHEVDAISDQALLDPTPELLRSIQRLKHGVLHLRRVIAPQREIMNRLSRDDLPQISERHRIYYRDLYDHVVRIHDLSESVREMVTDSLDIYLTTVANKTNEVMKALALVSTIFLPLTFVAGVYGMNFEHQPEFRWRYGYPAVWAIFVVIIFGMIWLFKRRRWL